MGDFLTHLSQRALGSAPLAEPQLSPRAWFALPNPPVNAQADTVDTPAAERGIPAAIPEEKAPHSSSSHSASTLPTSKAIPSPLISPYVQDLPAPDKERGSGPEQANPEEIFPSELPQRKSSSERLVPLTEVEKRTPERKALPLEGNTEEEERERSVPKEISPPSPPSVPNSFEQRQQRELPPGGKASHRTDLFSKRKGTSSLVPAENRGTPQERTHVSPDIQYVVERKEKEVRKGDTGESGTRQLLLPDHRRPGGERPVHPIRDERREREERASDTSRTVNITIGRLEVRGIPEQKKEQRPLPKVRTSSPSTPAGISLSQYLKEYSRRRG